MEEIKINGEQLEDKKRLTRELERMPVMARRLVAAYMEGIIAYRDMVLEHGIEAMK